MAGTDIVDIFTATARIQAPIDDHLKSLDGGPWEETTGWLFNYFVDIDHDSTLTHSANATVLLLQKDYFLLVYSTTYHGSW